MAEKSRRNLRTENGTDRESYGAADAVVKETRSNVCNAAGERGDRQDKQRGRSRDLDGKAQEINERRDVKKPPPMPRKLEMNPKTVLRQAPVSKVRALNSATSCESTLTCATCAMPF